MKKNGNIIWGLILVAAGILVALKTFGLLEFNLFFDGWWTLFIIVPCAVGLFTEREKTGNLIGIALGVGLLLCCQGVLDFGLLWKLIVPAAVIVIGLKLIFGGLFGNKANELITTMKESGRSPRVGCATFSGCKLDFTGEDFDGAELTAVFGGVECDLREALIQQDCAIRVSAIFGGIDIYVPDNVNVKVNSTSIFGGVSNKTAAKKDAVTLYVTGTCMFGGVDIK